MKKLIFLISILIGSISTQSLFGMHVLKRTPVLRPHGSRVQSLQHGRHYTTKKGTPKKDNDGDIVHSDKDIVYGYGDIFHGDKAGGNIYVAGGKTTKIVIPENQGHGRDIINASPFSYVNTGFSFSPFTPFIWTARLCGKGALFIGKKTKDLLFPNTVKNDAEKIETSHDSTLITKKMPLNGINSIGFSGIGNLEITPCNKNCPDKEQCTKCAEDLTIIAPKSIMSWLRQEIQHNHLTLGFENNTNVHVPNTIKYHATVKDIKQIGTSGSVSVHLNPTNADHLTLNLAGSTNLRAPSINVKKLVAYLTGSGNALVGGTAKKLCIQTAGSSEFNAKNLTGKDSTVTTSGSSLVSLGGTEQLRYNASGSSKIYFTDNPEMSGETSGSAKVKKHIK